jgi:hypothetical protein
LDAQQGVEREGGKRKLVRVPELVLRRREMEERGALEMETCFLFHRRVWRDERCQEVWGNGHVGEFAEKQETVYVRGLRDLYGRERRRTLDQGQRDLWLRRKTELAHQVRHAHTL